MKNHHSRRALLNLAGIIVGSAAGCLFAEDTDVHDLHLFNNRDREITVTTVVTRTSDGTDILNDTTSISADGFHDYHDPIEGEGTYRIDVSVENGPENRYEWEAPASEAHGVSITITEDDIEFVETVA